jgi:bacteriorhodopsin
LHCSFYGAIACAGIGLQLSTTGYRLASVKGERLRVFYVRCSLLMIVIWSGYGVVWALSEGGNVVSPDVEGVLYGILDLLGGPVFGSVVAYAARDTDD